MSPALTVESGRLGTAGITQYEGREISRDVDCSYVTKHWPHHRPHPATGRLVCTICHPPTPATPDQTRRALEHYSAELALTRAAA